ncbi:nucleotidyltransferase family protein [Saccharopolyspora sp. CA-218241]|uniref:nucleotidyltransferase family protein n=1 Tax=Saccharopolyspora sp. CA-218241 TaxID=3240027 RepID=UPI003D97935D
MHELIEANRHEIEELCRTLPVRRLGLFGSGADGSFDATTSDVDVLVEFDVGPGFDHFGTYFDLKEGLEGILGRPVDLVSVGSVRNPYFKQRILDTRELLYAA